MESSRLLTILGFIAIGVVSRLLPHPPNFTALNALALFGAFYLGNSWLSLATLLSTLFLSDMIFGMHSTLPFVYLSFGLTLLIGEKLKRGLYPQPLVCVGVSLLFFFVTNFGVWVTGALYPKTATGLGLCYLAALPFLSNQIVGDLAYGALLFSFIYVLESLRKPSFFTN